MDRKRFTVIVPFLYQTLGGGWQRFECVQRFWLDFVPMSGLIMDFEKYPHGNRPASTERFTVAHTEYGVNSGEFKIRMQPTMLQNVESPEDVSTRMKSTGWQSNYRSLN